MTEEHLGAEILIELGLSYAENIAPNLTTEQYDHLSQIMTQYVQGKLDYSSACQQYSEIIGRDEPVVKVKEILDITETPIAFYDENFTGEEDPRTRKKTRTWGGYEDQRLIAGVFRYGLDNWPLVAQFIGNGRTRAQCAQRWARGLNPRICKKHWSLEEDAQLQRLVQTYGEKAWTKIASVLGNRSDVQCRYHYRQISKGELMTTNYLSLRQTPLTLSVVSIPRPQYIPIMQPKMGPVIIPQPVICPIMPPPSVPPNQQWGLYQSSIVRRPNSEWTLDKPKPQQQIDSFLKNFK